MNTNLYIVSLILILNLGWGSISKFSPSKISLEEICDNAVDDDNDGLIDLNDPDCDCPVLEPISLIPNPSFEEMNCCPSNRSQLNCADTWIQASDPTTDYIHTCGWLGWDDFPPPRPFPDGNGIIGFRDGRVIQGNPERNWKEYTGACLLGPLKRNVAYRFEFFIGFLDPQRSPAINVTFFGTSDCANLPFGRGDAAFGCPTNGPDWIRLGSVRVNGVNRWVKTQIDITPSQDINAIAIGPDCPGVPASRSIYYFFDNLVLADQRSFDFRINEINHPCSEDFLLSVPEEENLQYQWYKEGIALLGETAPEITRMYGEGVYQVRLVGEDICNITSAYSFRIPRFDFQMETSICEGEFYPFGNENLDREGEYLGDFQSINGCDSMVSLRLNVIGDVADTLSAKIFEGESYEIANSAFQNAGQYQLDLISSLGCDSTVFLNLEYYQVFFPNAFSPNGDGINDFFNVFGEDDLQGLSNLKIFDRWGGMVYEANNITPSDSSTGWDGRHAGQLLNNGVYVYVAILRMEDGQERLFQGSVLLVH